MSEDKKPEDLVKAKQEAFKERPNDFVDMNDMLFCVLRGPEGHHSVDMQLYVGNVNEAQATYIIGLATKEMIKASAIIAAKNHAQNKPVITPGQFRQGLKKKFGRHN